MRKPTNLTEDQITEIKRDCIPTSHYAGYSTFARKYGVHHSEIKREYKRILPTTLGFVLSEINFDKVKAYKDKKRGYELPKITNNELLKRLKARMKASKSA
jgi:hypothetical protein